jgi:hypothetical protein
MWPYNEDDSMELGTTGWIPVGEGHFRHKITGHIIDETGIEYDQDGKIVFNPNDPEKINE